MSKVCNDCKKCGEDAVLIDWRSTFWVRVRRKSKCRGYRSNRICKTAIVNTAQEAIDLWNKSEDLIDE